MTAGKSKVASAAKKRPVSGGTAAQSRQGSEELMPHEFLLKVARGETIDGHVPTFAERLDAAKQALPYFAPRLAPEPARDDEEEKLTVTVLRFAGEGPVEGAPGGATGVPDRKP